MPATARMPPLNSRARPSAWIPCLSRTARSGYPSAKPSSAALTRRGNVSRLYPPSSTAATRGASAATRREEQDVRLEGLDRRRDLRFERVEPLAVAQAGREWHVDRRLALLVLAAGAREDPHLVQRRVEDGVVVPEDVLRPVAVVDVVVHDRDSPGTLGLQRAGGDRDIVQEAEAERGRRRRVMPRGSHEREAAGAPGLDRGPRREQGRSEARFGRDRVRLELRRHLDRREQL